MTASSCASDQGAAWLIIRRNVLSIYIVDPCLIQTFSIRFNHMQIWIWHMNHWGEDGHIRNHTMCLFGTYNTCCHIYDSKQRCLVRLDASEGAHIDECIRLDWLLSTGEGIWTRDHMGGGEVRKRTVSVPLNLDFISLLCHSRLPLLFSFTLSVCASGPTHVLYLCMLDRSSKVHSWGTSGFSIMRCQSRCSSPYESIQSTLFP